MPTLGEVIGYIIAIAGGVGGGSLLRAWGQNRNERTTTLTDEQKNFRADLVQRNEYLRGRLDAIDSRNAELVQVNAQLMAKVEIYEARIEQFGDQLTISFADRERLSQTVRALDTKVKAQEGEITTLREEIAKLQRRRVGDNEESDG